MAKANYWTITDAETRKRGEQTGLDTLGAAANAISIPPGEYGRKVETQRN